MSVTLGQAAALGGCAAPPHLVVGLDCSTLAGSEASNPVHPDLDEWRDLDRALSATFEKVYVRLDCGSVSEEEACATVRKMIWNIRR